MAATSRRVSYILPMPNDPPPLLSLPPIEQVRRGHTSPFFLPKSDPSFQSKNPFLNPSPPPSAKPPHPRHCLGISSLALDTSTLLSNTDSPAGILYSGGRDGLVASWELNVPHKKRRGRRYEDAGRTLPVKWERIGDGAEFFDDEDEESDEDDVSSSDEDMGEGWVGVGDGAKREVPYEDRWEVDHEELNKRQPATTFRQSSQTHTDWVNAMLLCNLNQTVITASSDRTIRAWSPHAASDAEGLSPALVGTHRDYVRSLAWAKGPGLLFSGSLDRTLSIWDVASPHPDSPIFSIDMSKVEDFGGVGMEGERGSVYALGVDPAGKVLAAGTPERVVRLWDPRQGERSIGKLIGHSDCVRSVIVSEDGRYMLTGSSDTTIKLWSLAAHRCLHTFNHHTSSVWSLHSSHPNLERFYSGSRDGHLCVVDLEQCSDMSDGECVVLAREGDVTGDYESKSGDEGIRCITAMDDEYVWTATGSAELRRWKDVGRRVDRLEFEGASYGVAAASPNEALALGHAFAPTDGVLRNKRLSVDEEPLSRTDSRSVAFAPPPTSASPSAIPSTVRDRLNPPRTTFSGASIASSIVSDSSAADDVVPAHSSSLNGIPYESLVCLGLPDSPYSFGFRDDAHSHRPGSIASVPQGMNALVDGSPRKVSVQLDSGSMAQLARLKFEDREIASEAVPLRKTPDEVVAGRSGLVRSLLLNDRQHVLTVDTQGEVAAWNIIRGVCIGRFSSADVAAAFDIERGVAAGQAVRKHSNEVLELVKDRVEGETMVITWCQVDTKIGSLVVHLEEGRVFDAEVYADELGLEGYEGIREDMRLNLGKWALANLFKGLIKAEEREVVSMSPPVTHRPLPNVGSAPLHITIERPPVSPPHRQRAMTNSSQPPSLAIPGVATPALTPAILPDADSMLSRSAPTASSGWQSMHALRDNLPVIPQSPSSANTGTPAIDATTKDYFSPRKRDPSPGRLEAKDSPKQTTPGGSLGTTPQTPGSFMGKLKGLGKKKTTETVMSPVVEAEPVVEDTGPKLSERESTQLHILDTVRAGPFRPPPPWEAPPLDFPSNTSLLISEESKDAGAWVVTYRSQVSSTERDMESIENNSPMWLLDYLFTSRTRVKDPVKLTFILEPIPGCGLKEMPEGVLRAKKIMAFIVDKLDLHPGRGRAGSIASLHSKITSNPRKTSNPVVPASIKSSGAGVGGSDHAGAGEPLEPEEVIELVCGSTVVDPKITLATLKHYYGSGGDMLLHYRPKEGVTL